MKKNFLSSRVKREDGNVVNLISTVLVIILMFIMILVTMSYGGLIEKRLELDHIVRNYLYITEEYGYLSTENQANLRTDLQNAGCTMIDLTGTTISQTPYGSPVKVKVSAKLANPLYYSLRLDRISIFTYAFPQEITYTEEYASTSRW